MLVGRNGKYANDDALENVIRYVTRTRPIDDGNDLFSSGVCGADYTGGIDTVITQFQITEDLYNIDTRGGRRVFHEVFSLAPFELQTVSSDIIYNALFIAGRKASLDYFNQGFQVVYAVHISNHPHIHFAINAINFKTGLKWRARKADIWQREKNLNAYLYEYVNQMNPIKSIAEFVG